MDITTNNAFPLRVYTFIDAEGHHYGYELVNSIEELVAKLVCNEQDKLVTDTWDLPVLDTFGSFVNQVYNNVPQYGDSAPNYRPWFFNEVFPLLLEAQNYYMEQHHPCGDCAEYPDCKRTSKECEYSEAYEGGE